MKRDSSICAAESLKRLKERLGGERNESDIQSFLLEILLFWSWHVKNKSLDELVVKQFSAGKMPFPGKISIPSVLSQSDSALFSRRRMD